MGARRISQQRNATGFMRFISMRSLKRLAAGSLLLAAILIANALYAPDTLAFKTIQVYGELKWLDRDELNRLVLKDLDGGFFSLDVTGLKHNLEQHAWIKAVSIRRVWPDTLQIHVTEQQPVAVWNRDAIVNREGELFLPAATGVPGGLTAINGPHGMHQALIKHYNVLSGMAAPLGLNISDISVNDRRAMRVTFNNGVQILMGRVRDETESGMEMMRFVRAYKVTLATQIDRVQVVDLRYTNGLAVRWKQPPLLQGKNNYGNNNNALEAG